MYVERRMNTFEEAPAYYRLARKCSVYHPTFANASNIAVAAPFPLTQYLNLSLEGSNSSRAIYVSALLNNHYIRIKIEGSHVV